MHHPNDHDIVARFSTHVVHRFKRFMHISDNNSIWSSIHVCMLNWLKTMTLKNFNVYNSERSLFFKVCAYIGEDRYLVVIKFSWNVKRTICTSIYLLVYSVMDVVQTGEYDVLTSLICYKHELRFTYMFIYLSGTIITTLSILDIYLDSKFCLL